MKHLVICFVCLVLIAFYTLFSFIYINNFTSNVKSEIKYATENNYPIESVNKISDIFSGKKHTLNILVNTDQVDVFENTLTQLESSVKYEDLQNIEVNSKLLLQIVENIEKNNKNII